MKLSVRDAYDQAVQAIEAAEFEIVNFWRFNEKSDIWNFRPHTHHFYELIFFLHGNAQISLSDRSLYATFSDALLYPPGTEHTEHLQINHRQEIYCLQVRSADFHIPGVLHVQDQRQQIKPLLDGLFAEYGSRESDPRIVTHYLRALATIMAREHCFGVAPANPVERCMMYMRHNIAAEVTLQQLADLIHVSRSYLSRMFVQHTGVTPMRYMLDIRIDAAKSLLMTTNQRVSDIAEAVGFNSPKYFCSTFHRCTGLSPRDFRNAEGVRAFTKEATTAAIQRDRLSAPDYKDKYQRIYVQG